MKRRGVLLALALALAGSAAAGATYHLDAVNGSDTAGDGSAAAPWQSLAKVFTVIAGGDTVVLATGNYGPFQQVATAAGGWDLFDDWVTFTEAPGADAKFESVRIAYTGVRPSYPVLEGFFDAYLRFEGIHILDGVSCSYARHWALVGCLIERVGPWTGSVDNIEKTAVSFREGTDILIAGCEITNTGTGLAGCGHDVRLLNNHIHHGTHDGIRVTGFWNSLIEGNRIHSFDDGVSDAEANWSRHCDLIHVFIPGPAPEGWQNHNVVFRNNVLYDTEAQIVQFNNYYASPIRNELITFENNVFGPSHANMFNNADPTDGLIFRNNTVVVLDQPRPFGRWTLDNYTLRISGASTGVQVYNNLLGSGGPSTGAEVVIFDYNLYQIAPSSPPAGVDGSRAFGRFTLVGVDPMFVDPAAFDGELDPASPAIDFGTRLMAPTPIHAFDIAGEPRDNRPDLGAWELPGQNPDEEPVPVAYDDEKTVFVDDFADGHYNDVDPWLDGPHQQGMSWHRPDPVDFKYVVSPSGHFGGGNALIDPLGSATDVRLAWLFSDQGGDWIDYDFSFDAANSYLVLGSGVMVLAQDRDTCYWLDISRDNGRLVRFIDGVAVELARDADIELPHAGVQVYKVSVRHGEGAVTLSVDTLRDGTEDFSYTDTDPAAVARFATGGVGFHNDVVNQYHRVHYDNIRVDVLAKAAGPAQPGDCDGDGDVDLDDFVIVKQNFGRSGVGAGAAEGDLDGDGDVDLDDFVVLKQHFGT
ncbi:MAG: right-handed parallel beta-helix repeat-containing protein [Planctomycetes bacterium]|nr:right-handed parallel beta-helix repeat-containing protein [Planctomycetota bacterium]